MNFLRTVVQEVVGLFIDDGSFALAIVAWLGIVGLVAWRIDAARAWTGFLLFVGLAAILGGSALWRARK